MEYNGKGPLLSARMPDTDVIWRRAEQMREVCQEVCDLLLSADWLFNHKAAQPH